MSILRPLLPPPAAASPTETPAGSMQIPQESPKILFVPLGAISTKKLQRDRSCHLDPQIDDLKASILATGLSNPIRVDISRPGTVELVQGWRRLAAYHALLADTGLACFAEIPAIPVENFTTTEKLYRRMVDENMVRKDLSWAEMGRIALIYKTERSADCDSVEEAVDILFASASPQKRNYIRHFADLMQRLEKVLEYPEAIPRALGVALNISLKNDSRRLALLFAALRAQPQRDARAELAILHHFAAEPEDPADAPDGPQANYTPARPKPARPAKRPGAMIRLDLMSGAVICTVTAGRVELQLDRDFTQTPAARLETAVAAFCAALQ